MEVTPLPEKTNASILILGPCIGILFLLAFFAARTPPNNQRMIYSESKKKAHDLAMQIRLYQQDCEAQLSEEQGFQALIKEPKSGVCKYWRGPYLSELPNDSWQRPFRYIVQDGKGFVTSLGRDGKVGGDGYNKDIAEPVDEPPASSEDGNAKKPSGHQ